MRHINKNRIFILFFIILILPTIFLILSFYVQIKASKGKEDFKTYKKLSVEVMPKKVINDILKLDILKADIKLQGENDGKNFVKFASLLAAKYYGDWREYSEEDLYKLSDKLQDKDAEKELKQLYSNYDYFYRFYDALFSNFIGTYQISQEVKDESQPAFHEKYGLKSYFPIAYGYDVKFNDDFDNEINLAKKDGHFGNDILIKQNGTPIIAVESGVVSKSDEEDIQSKIEITSFDGKRTYIYGSDNEGSKEIKINALKQYDIVSAGDVIGFFRNDNSDNKKKRAGVLLQPHLHFGLRILIESGDQKKEVYVNTHNILKILEHHKSEIIKTDYGVRPKYIFRDKTLSKQKKTMLDEHNNELFKDFIRGPVIAKVKD